MYRKMSVQVASAYDLILKRILSYEMAPESVISDNQLAKEFGMSRAPVREAILLLAMDGLVQNSPNHKMIVAPIKLDDIIDIMHVRNALETEALRIIAENGWLSANQEKKLQELHRKFSNAADLNTVSEHYSYDDMFHSELIGYSKSRRIVDILEQMRLQMQRARWLNLAVPSRQREATREHEDILNAILDKDLDRTVDCLHLHFANSAESFRSALSDQRMKQVAMTISNFFSQA